MLKKSLEIPFMDSPGGLAELPRISEVIEKDGVRVPIKENNWQDFSYQPETILFCAWTTGWILLKYRVKESHIKAVNTELNSEVYKDSCVEFFISTGRDYFYNFEFNCIGTAYSARGIPGDRELLEEKEVEGIRTFSTLGEKPISTREITIPWELTVAVPFSIFREEEFRDPSGQKFHANFYKCGDELPRPHYLSWNPIEAAEPDFHRPDFFGKIRFLSKHP
jgi:hypothetical protein